MNPDRRKFLLSLVLSPLLASAGPGGALARSGRLPSRINLSANAAADGRYGFAAIGGGGEKLFEHRLPGRGHGFAVRPGGDEAAVFARRPGRFAVAFDVRSGVVTATLAPPEGRHFFGHGAFSADGGTLFTTENDYNAGRGVIGLWDARAGYRRIGEFPSRGIGPHEMLLDADGGTLIVANGGLLTHPDFGRRKLNIPTMNPSLAYLDARNGRLLEEHFLPAPRHRLLSVRHIAQAGDGTVCVALQDQGPRGDTMSLVAFHRRGEDALALAEAPPPVTRRLRGYMGSVAVDASGSIAAVSAPRGNLITFWSAAERRYLGSVELADGCGVAADGATGGFVATSGAGGAIHVNAVDRAAVPATADFFLSRHWDNHLVPVVRPS